MAPNRRIHYPSDAKFDMVAAWSIYRPGNRYGIGPSFWETHTDSISTCFHRVGIDTITPAGRAIFQMRGVFAELERAIARERIKVELAKARAFPCFDRNQLNRQVGGTVGSGFHLPGFRQDRQSDISASSEQGKFQSLAITFREKSSTTRY